MAANEFLTALFKLLAHVSENPRNTFSQNAIQHLKFHENVRREGRASLTG
jgi:hypothetical protein